MSGAHREFLQGGKPPLILASSSKVRSRLLEAAGLAFIIQPPGLDEHVMRQAIGSTGVLGPQDVAEVLARAKAEAVSQLAARSLRHRCRPGARLGGRILAKPDRYGSGAERAARSLGQEPHFA